MPPRGQPPHPTVAIAKPTARQTKRAMGDSPRCACADFPPRFLTYRKSIPPTTVCRWNASFLGLRRSVQFGDNFRSLFRCELHCSLFDSCFHHKYKNFGAYTRFRDRIRVSTIASCASVIPQLTKIGMGRIDNFPSRLV